MTDKTALNDDDDSIIDNETKSARFKRIANPRLAKCQTVIRSLGKCASKDYEFTEEQIDTIERILRDEVINCIRRYRTGAETNTPQIL